MSINRYQPHIFVLPEDDANRQMANGFVKSLTVNGRAIQILPCGRGWGDVLDNFERFHAPEMGKYPERRLVLLIDFDQDENRLSNAKNRIPPNLVDRVFVIGVLSEPEKLKGEVNKTLEEIGETVAEGCPDNKSELWETSLLRHNQSELNRLISSVRSFLFVPQQ